MKHAVIPTVLCCHDGSSDRSLAKTIAKPTKRLLILMVRQMVRSIYICCAKAAFSDGSRNGSRRLTKRFLLSAVPVIKTDR